MLIAAHSSLGRDFIRAYELIVGTPEQVDHVGLFHGDSVDDLESLIEEKIRTLDTGEGVLILCDLFGGSPSNCAAQAMMNLGDQHDIKCVTGVNFPMVIEALSTRDSGSTNLSSLVANIEAVAKEGIIDLGDKFGI